MRRNLLSEFENTDSPICVAPEVDFDVTTPVRPETELSVDEIEHSRGWKAFVTILDFACGDMCISDFWILSFPSNISINTIYTRIPVSDCANNVVHCIDEHYLESLL